MSAPDRLRALLAEPGFVVMPAVWDGLSAKLAAAAGFKTAFLSGSCVAASRLGGPDLDLLSFAEMLDSFNMVRGAAPDTLVLADADHGYGNAMNVQRTVRAVRPCGRGRDPGGGQDHAAGFDLGRQAVPATRGDADEDACGGAGCQGLRRADHGAH